MKRRETSERSAAMTIMMEIHRTADSASMIKSELFDRLVSRIVEDEGLERGYAERVMRQTLVFLRACADNPTTLLSPTNAVDIGWHTFVLHTADYAAFCEKMAGRFIHHNPICTGDIRSGTALARTIKALEATGYPIDEQLWTVDDAADCNQCHATCYDSP
jgi:hypothetical protein